MAADTAITGTLPVNKGATVTQSAGTVSATRLILNDSTDEVASFYKLTGGVHNITGTEPAGTSASTNAILVGHWHNGTSKLTVSGGCAICGKKSLAADCADKHRFFLRIFACGKNPHATPKLLNLLNSSTFFACGKNVRR